MNGQDLGLLAKHLLIDLHHNLTQMRILFILPGGVFAHLRIGAFIEGRQLPEFFKKRFLLCVDGRPDGESGSEPLSQLQDTEIQAGLHQAFHILAPRLDAVGSGTEQANDLGSGFVRKAVASQSIHVKGLNQRFRLVVLLPYLRLEFLGNVVDSLQVNAHGNQGCLAGTGDGVVLGAAGQGSQPQRHELLNSRHKLAHELIGVGAVLVDFRAGVAALQAGDGQADAGTIDGPALHRQRNCGSGAAGAGHGEDAFVLGIQVNQGAALQHGHIDGISAQHTDFLVNGDDNLQRRMGNGLVGQKRHGVGQGNAVIAAQGSTLGEDIAAVMGQVQALNGHVQGHIGVLFADHIHVALEDYGLMVFHAAGALPEENDVAHFVLNIG